MAKAKMATDMMGRPVDVDNRGRYIRPDSPEGWSDITFGGRTMPGCDPMGRPMSPGARPYIDSNAVVAQERRGAERIVKSDTMPTDLGKSRATFERWGFKFLGPVDGDPLYQHVELPTGWTRKHAEDDYRTVYLLDPNGARRGLVWAKDTSYDRAAYGYAMPRYRIECVDYNNKKSSQHKVLDTKNGNKVVHTTGAIAISAKTPGYEAYERTEKAALAWLAASGLVPEGPDGALLAWDLD